MAAPFRSIPNRIGMPRIREEELHPERGKGRCSPKKKRLGVTTATKSLDGGALTAEGGRATGEEDGHGAELPRSSSSSLSATGTSRWWWRKRKRKREGDGVSLAVLPRLAAPVLARGAGTARAGRRGASGREKRAEERTGKGGAARAHWPRRRRRRSGRRPGR
jgi:hypothetical protein